MDSGCLDIYLEFWKSSLGREMNYSKVSRRISALSGHSRVEIDRPEAKKPRLLHPDGWHFSLSHSFELVCCAYSTMEIGLDLECHRRRDYSGVADYWFRPEERRLVQNGMSPQGFFTLWTQKEAWLKLKGRSVWEIGECPGQDELAKSGRSFTFLWNNSTYSVSYCLNMED